MLRQEEVLALIVRVVILRVSHTRHEAKAFVLWHDLQLGRIAEPLLGARGVRSHLMAGSLRRRCAVLVHSGTREHFALHPST